MIERYEVLIEVEGGTDPLWRSPARGTLMHGLLVKGAAAEALHSGKSSLRPYTQHMQALSPGRYVWTINVLARQANALVEWLHQCPAELHLEHYDIGLRVTQIDKVFSCSYEQFMLNALDQLPPKYSTFEILTPMIFKKSGQQNVWQWPEARLMIQSALSRWNLFSDTEKFDDPQILEDITAHVQPFSFQVQSQHVSMDGIRFAGTVGKISFIVHNRVEVRQLVNLAGLYSEFCGLGAKTAMGLGAVRFLPSRMARSSNRSKQNHELIAG